ncbi:hypothetical protein [Deinococcus peraridilitoris]|uniref:Copper/zinc superoxide dismutase (SODC) n=1 Tax=Deinococcus peraridilitoris (strain DSM 19664 / LMG 22246 / CIP 109416 / KR-200) TaxID=937777 RepID=L0A0E5_DEIPD|nr:hypothetical protein [Deinococcus peraridilitoris]AFZ67316.1 hypothetical protein Deipe_1799 [Deinococcus peraridilitoris DSM 19664]
MKKLLMGALGVALLGACAPTSQMSFAVSKQEGMMTELNATGTVTRAMRFDGFTNSSATVAGLRPNTFYVSHYHVQGDANKPPCLSGGAPIVSTTMVGRTDATGNLVLSGSHATSEVEKGTYFNIHTARDASGTPADGGVTCANLR